MNRAADYFVRPAMAARARSAQRTAHHQPRPAGMAHTRATGPWPLHILLLGCGDAVGVGVLTHELGVAGHLGRIVSAATARGVEVDVIVDADMTPTTALSALSRIRLSQYDAVVVMLGAADAARLTSITGWGHDLRRLLTHIRDATSATTETYLVTFAVASKPRGARSLPRAIAGKHARRLNAELRKICSMEPSTILVDLEVRLHGTAVETVAAGRRSTDAFRAVALHISHRLSSTLNLTPGSSARRVDEVDEIARQRAVDELDVIDEAASKRLDRITAMAQEAFGVAAAAVTIIDGQWQVYASRQNIDMTRTPRRDALCNVTITGRDALVVHDASVDPRFADNPLVTGIPHIRFYAGYPIEAPDGERVGTFCLLHDEPMDFTEENLIQLRTLALFAQDELWSEGYHYEREFGQRTGDGQADELLKSGFRLR